MVISPAFRHDRNDRGVGLLLIVRKLVQPSGRACAGESGLPLVALAALSF
ncbi:MAG: hypothetical protein ACYTG0_11360 [Planctomycetota bacterium]